MGMSAPASATAAAIAAQQSATSCGSIISAAPKQPLPATRELGHLRRAIPGYCRVGCVPTWAQART